MGTSEHEDHELEPGMSGALVSSTVLFALVHGLEPPALEAAAGLPLAQLSVADARFPEDVVAKIWRALRELHPGQPLTLRMAAAAPAGYFGPLAYGAQYAPNLRVALDNFVRYRALLSSQLHTVLVEEEDQAWLVTRHPHDELDAGAGSEVGLAIGRRFLDEVLGIRDALQAVEFRHQPVGPVADYERLFRVPVRFGASRSGLGFAREALERPLPASQAQLFEFIEAHLRQAVDQLSVADSLGDVRQAIAANAEQRDYEAKSVARALGVSLRVLQRRVAAEGTTLRKLLDEVREAQAKRLLEDKRLSIDEVAYILDYSDERAFRRAFKRMAGVSPAQYRRKVS